LQLYTRRSRRLHVLRRSSDIFDRCAAR
jgi:hypothetical protein